MTDVWDEFHPADADEDIADEFEGDEFDFGDLPPPAEIPTLDHLPDVVDYSARGPNDFMLAGPLGEGRGNGRHFESLTAAKVWAHGKYGAARVRVPPQESEFRWALLIKGML